MDTLLKLSDSLPLTCSRAGICCHQKMVRLNPWEVASLAHYLQMSTPDFVQAYTVEQGTRIRFENACSLYNAQSGCLAHPGRPLACRLYPLGRIRQAQDVRWMYRGTQFPCLAGCPEVQLLPHMTVEEYLCDQGSESFQEAQDAYLEIMQDLGEWALTLLHETGLTFSQKQKVHQQWKYSLFPTVEYHTPVYFPELSVSLGAQGFVDAHAQQLKTFCERKFSSPSSMAQSQEFSVQAMAMALLLARSAGMDLQSLLNRWKSF